MFLDPIGRVTKYCRVPFLYIDIPVVSAPTWTGIRKAAGNQIYVGEYIFSERSYGIGIFKIVNHEFAGHHFHHFPFRESGIARFALNLVYYTGCNLQFVVKLSGYLP